MRIQVITTRDERVIDFPLPFCDVCQKKVNYLTFTPNIYNHTWELVVKCHGEKEVTILTKETLINMLSIEPGIAFKRTRSLK